MRQKGSVYVHCNAGVHRSMTIVAGLFYYIDRLPLREVQFYSLKLKFIIFEQVTTRNQMIINYDKSFFDNHQSIN